MPKLVEDKMTITMMKDGVRVKRNIIEEVIFMIQLCKELILNLAHWEFVFQIIL